MLETRAWAGEWTMDVHTTPDGQNVLIHQDDDLILIPHYSVAGLIRGLTKAEKSAEERRKQWAEHEPQPSKQAHASNDK